MNIYLELQTSTNKCSMVVSIHFSIKWALLVKTSSVLDIHPKKQLRQSLTASVFKPGPKLVDIHLKRLDRWVYVGSALKSLLVLKSPPGSGIFLGQSAFGPKSFQGKNFVGSMQAQNTQNTEAGLIFQEWQGDEVLCGRALRGFMANIGKKKSLNRAEVAHNFKILIPIVRHLGFLSES